MSKSIRREIINVPTRNSRTVEKIQLSTETILESVVNEEEDIVSLNENIQESVDVEIDSINNTEDNLVTTYENIEEQSDLSDLEDDFDDVLKSNYNVRKSNDGLKHIPSETSYIRQIESVTGFHVLQNNNVWNAYKKGPIDLFHLFPNKNFITERILSWTNNKMGNNLITRNGILAVLGLKIAMSSCKVNNLKVYFSGRAFGANDDYRKTMTKHRFQEIRGNLNVSPPERIDEKKYPCNVLRSASLWNIYFKSL